MTSPTAPAMRKNSALAVSSIVATPTFYFQCVRADALDCGDFARGRGQRENVRAVLKDILGHGNEGCLLPGEPEAKAAAESERLGGLVFSAAEVDAFDALAREAGVTLDRAALRAVEQG